MRYLLFLVLAVLAMPQQSTTKKDTKATTKKDEPSPLFKNKIGYKSSTGTKESATLSFNGIDPSGKVNARMLAVEPSAAQMDEARQMASNEPSRSDLKAFLKEGKLHSR